MARRHHTVPQFYLKLFADASGRITLTSRDDLSRSFPTGVSAAVAESGFYRIECEDLVREEDRAGFDPESIESALSLLEGAMAPTIQKLAGGVGVIDVNDWYRLVQFTVVQTVRGNRWRRNVSAAATAYARRQVLEGVDDARGA